SLADLHRQGTHDHRLADRRRRGHRARRPPRRADRGADLPRGACPPRHVDPRRMPPRRHPAPLRGQGGPRPAPGRTVTDPLAPIRAGLVARVGGWAGMDLPSIRADFAAYLAEVGPEGAALVRPRETTLAGLPAAWIGD